MNVVDDYLYTPMPPNSGRNNALFKVAAYLKDEEIDIWQAKDILLDKAVSDGLSRKEAERAIDSAYNRPVSKRSFENNFNFESVSIQNDKPLNGYPKPNSNWKMEDFKRLLRCAFNPDDFINIVPDFMVQSGKATPTGKGFHKKVSELLLVEGETSEIFKINHNFGAWLRINPTDGAGVADKNIKRFRHVLIESDTMEIAEQWRFFKKEKLPISIIMHSGKKSLHAWVRVDASNVVEYKERVKKIYDYLENKGFELDQANKNPSRLSRLPGVEREGSPQYILCENTGLKSFSDWIDYINKPQLPEIENVHKVNQDPPAMSPEVIKGVLRRSHVMMISGPSKAGKSFFLINLSLCLATGSSYLGMECVKSRILYINIEIDKNSFFNRVRKIAENLEISNYHNFHALNLRGYNLKISDFANYIIEITKEQNFDAIIIDPIYKLYAGKDENSSGDMTEVLNFFDTICLKSNTSLIYASHFSKGSQGKKAAIDRTSGSGAFARYPDAILTLSELEQENAYRMEYNLREFYSCEPVSLMWDYPSHYIDETLDEMKIRGEVGRRKTFLDKDIYEAWIDLDKINPAYVKIKDIAEHFGKSDRQIRRRVDNFKPVYGKVLKNIDGFVRLFDYKKDDYEEE